MRRLALRIGFTQSDNPLKIEKDLMKLVLRSEWGKFNYLMIEHGRRVCTARSPKCDICSTNMYCDYFKKSREISKNAAKK